LLPHYDRRTWLVLIDVSEDMAARVRLHVRDSKVDKVEDLAVGDAENLAYPKFI
jgi:phosphatidylethanolamine/phosphatidyl-N-methylethanolamine N-methyltransferase